MSGALNPTDDGRSESTTTDDGSDGFADAISAALAGEDPAAAEPGGTDEKDGTAAPTEAAGTAASDTTEKDDSRPPTEKASGAGDDKDATAAAAKDGEVAEDDLDTPLDDAVDERTRARFDKMRENYKVEQAARTEAEEGRAAAESAFTELRDTIRETGASNEDFSQTISFLALRNSGDPDSMRSAYDMLMSEAGRLGQALGIPVPGADVNPLADYPDLAEKVTNLDMTEDAALEVVQARKARALRESTQARHDEAQRSNADGAALVDAGRTAVNARIDELKRTDPEYAQKSAILQKSISSIAQSVPPDRWVDAVNERWEMITEALKLNDVATPDPNKTPLSGSANTSGTKVPQTFEQAVEMGLEGGGG